MGSYLPLSSLASEAELLKILGRIRRGEERDNAFEVFNLTDAAHLHGLDLRMFRTVPPIRTSINPPQSSFSVASWHRGAVELNPSYVARSDSRIVDMPESAKNAFVTLRGTGPDTFCISLGDAHVAEPHVAIKLS
jgi:hypothetical protein